MALSKTAADFLEANAASPVVEGVARPPGGNGATYTLADGRSFTLTRLDCEHIGTPRWDFSDHG